MKKCLDTVRRTPKEITLIKLFATDYADYSEENDWPQITLTKFTIQKSVKSAKSVATPFSCKKSVPSAQSVATPFGCNKSVSSAQSVAKPVDQNII